MKITPVCLVFALAPLAGLARDNGEDEAREKKWREAGYVLPALPDERNLIAFHVDAQPAGRFSLDSASLSIGEDGVTRYALVTRGDGASITTFEGIRCDTGEIRLYASLERNGLWRTFRNSAWRALAIGRSSSIFGYSGNDPRATLASDYVCDGAASARTVEEILGRLRGKRVDFIDPVRGIAP
jgi:hypothetical protein